MNTQKLCTQFLIPIAAIAALAGCTSVRVQPVAADNRIEHICIQENPKVQVGDFVAVMQEGFQTHGITSQVVRESTPAGCRYTSTYTARRTWDMAMYMTDAQIDIHRDGRQIASANYHLKGKGGFALNKWAGTRAKILPVIDQLLAQLPSSGRVVTAESNRAAAVAEPKVPVAASPPPVSGELAQRLSSLKDAYDAQLITKEEYDAKRRELVQQF
jgi:hypothetical protein